MNYTFPMAKWPTGPRERRMRKELMEILACPLCKNGLELRVAEEEGEEVIQGWLYCAECSEEYPIVDCIPNLLPPGLWTGKAE